MHGLRDIRVIDFTREIAGPYATKLFVDAGADVVKVEPAVGDPLRRYSATGADLGAHDGALFRFLNAGKRSVVGTPQSDEVRTLIADADLVVEDFGPSGMDVAALRAAHPGLVVLSLSPFGRTGAPRRSDRGPSLSSKPRPARWRCGDSLRASPTRPGGRISEWVAGAFAGAGTLPAVLRARKTGHGAHVDLSMLDAMNVSATIFVDLIYRLLGLREAPWPARTTETPSIEPSSDGWVGFNTNSAQQFADFAVLIERPDVQEDKELANVAGRTARFDEWQGIVREWTERHTTAEIVERASALRIPVAPVLNGKSVLEHPHFQERRVFVSDASGTFRHPRRPYRFNREDPPPPKPAPSLGEHTGQIEARPHGRPQPSASADLPLAGLRVLDMTNWWAGPAGAHVLATLGADVIHLESTARPDGVRYTGGMLQGKVEEWWEASAFFLAADANKRSLTLDLSDPRGRELCDQLIAQCDVLVENYSPRVLDGFGLTWERLQEINPRLSLVRMPAFGLDGPWRDNVGFRADDGSDHGAGLGDRPHGRPAAHPTWAVRSPRRDERRVRHDGRASGTGRDRTGRARRVPHGRVRPERRRRTGDRVHRLRQCDGANGQPRANQRAAGDLPLSGSLSRSRAVARHLDRDRRAVVGSAGRDRRSRVGAGRGPRITRGPPRRARSGR